MDKTLLGESNNLRNSAALFITYDGLLDPLGGSQILPYIKSISSHPRPVHIISFEKPDRYQAGADVMHEDLLTLGIGWTPLPFTRKFGRIGKLWDLLRMYVAAIQLEHKYKFTYIHCRSYQAMQVGCLLKRMFGSKTIFDMRGLWVDERVDGGIWKRGRLLDRFAYTYYKRIEKRLLNCADHVVVLTHRVVPELKKLSPGMTAKITIIPCCADFDHFEVSSQEQRHSVRSDIGIPANARVLTYLGSLGTWYMLEEMLSFFKKANDYWGNVHLLLVTRDWDTKHEEMLVQSGLESLRDRIHIKSATRSEVPFFLGCSDIMLSFIKPAYSKMASSPTKLSEAFAVGIPAISNIGIGDVDAMTLGLDAGALVDLSDPLSLEKVIKQLDEIAAKGGMALRKRSRAVLGLGVATAVYRSVYEELESL